jgi:predicted membrane protein DUF2306
MVTSVMRTVADGRSEAGRPERGIDETALGVNENVVRFPGWLIAGFWFCVVIALAVVIRRMIALLTPGTSGAPPELRNLDAWFRAHAVLTWVHISVALAFVLLLPFVFRVGAARPGAIEKAFFALGAITGATAYGMSRYAVGGWLERSAVLVFDTLFLVSLARAYTMHREGNAEKQRVWMIRAVAVLLGIATTRPVIGAFFATERLTHLTPAKFFGIAFWIGFSINTIVIELWLRSEARRSWA